MVDIYFLYGSRIVFFKLTTQIYILFYNYTTKFLVVNKKNKKRRVTVCLFSRLRRRVSTIMNYALCIMNYELILRSCKIAYSHSPIPVTTILTALTACSGWISAL